MGCLPAGPAWGGALGTSRDEVSDRIREAVDAYAAEMAALGQRLPDPVAAVGTIRAG